VLCEADAFFMRDGQYQFDHTLLPAAHVYCQTLFINAILQRKDVVVANTFTRRWSLQVYLDILDKLDISHTTRIIHLTSQYDNIHGVPEATVQRQRDNFEPMQASE
jgi:hypothetical protein